MACLMYLVILFETWLPKNTNYNLDIKGFKSEHLFRNKGLNVKKGLTSGGISVHYRDKFSSKITIVEKQQCGLIWLKVCKSLFSFDEDVYFCNVYIPPPNSTVLNHLQVDCFDKLEEGVETYKSLGKVFINGDFNSRTSNFDDYIELKITMTLQ